MEEMEGHAYHTKKSPGKDEIINEMLLGLSSKGKMNLKEVLDCSWKRRE